MSNNDELIFIDPPSGWKYGFPKGVTKEVYIGILNLKEWCIANGYPKKVADSYGDHFHIGISGADIPRTKDVAVSNFYTKEQVISLCESFFHKGESYGAEKTRQPDYYMYIDSPLSNLIKHLI